MSKGITENLKFKLSKRKEDHSLRSLTSVKNLIDFSSNDYLGFSRNVTIQKEAENILEKIDFKNGSTGSRLISGTHPLHIEVEKIIADFHDSEAALLYNSGYDANLGLFSSVLQKGDTIIYDELIHASIRDGIRLSNAKAYNFKHNSLEDLQNKIEKAAGNIYIAVESVYSMDGDAAPLKELVAISNNNNCYLIVDEAHASGVFGEKGCGLVQELNLQDEIFARVHTFGKALGCHGAVVLGSQELRNYLINFSRSFIYTTAASLHSVATISAAYSELIFTQEILRLKENIQFFKNTIHEFKLNPLFVLSESAIQCCIISGNKKVREIAQAIQNKGFDVKPILSPTVPISQERLRICLHSYNKQQEITEVLSLLATFVHHE
ncbi:aminotransferase class I/II-fold pyridoxal phosphate-dependent enzyme [Bacteroidota bacterium]